MFQEETTKDKTFNLIDFGENSFSKIGIKCTWGLLVAAAVGKVPTL